MKKFDPNRIRRVILDMAYSGATVHIGCAFSVVELLAVLYRNHLRLDASDPRSAGRDYMVLSKGHGVMAQYACLYELGWLPKADIDNYFKDGTRLKGLADGHVPGVEATCGSLGHGLSVAAGLALAAKLGKTDQMCYTLVGDGELSRDVHGDFSVGRQCLLTTPNRVRSPVRPLRREVGQRRHPLACRCPLKDVVSRLRERPTGCPTTPLVGDVLMC